MYMYIIIFQVFCKTLAAVVWRFMMFIHVWYIHSTLPPLTLPYHTLFYQLLIWTCAVATASVDSCSGSPYMPCNAFTFGSDGCAWWLKIHMLIYIQISGYPIENLRCLSALIPRNLVSYSSGTLVSCNRIAGMVVSYCKVKVTLRDLLTCGHL